MGEGEGIRVGCCCELVVCQDYTESRARTNTGVKEENQKGFARTGCGPKRRSEKKKAISCSLTIEGDELIWGLPYAVQYC